MSKLENPDQYTNEKFFNHLFNHINKYQVDYDPSLIKAKGIDNFKGKLFENVIKKSIDDYIKIYKSDVIKKIVDFRFDNGYFGFFTQDHNLILFKRGETKAELDGLYELNDNSLLILETKTRAVKGKGRRGFDRKMNVLKEATDRNLIFLFVATGSRTNTGMFIPNYDYLRFIIRNPLEKKDVKQMYRKLNGL
jgi:hypothetical protein